MDLIDKIKATFDCPFRYGSAEDLNMYADNTDMPAVFLYRLESGAAVRVGAQLVESADVVLFFLDRTSYEYTAEENEHVCNAQLARAIEWLDGLRNSSALKQVSDAKLQRVYLEFSGYYTGVSVRVSLRENVGIVCQEEDGIFTKQYNKIFV